MKKQFFFCISLLILSVFLLSACGLEPEEAAPAEVTIGGVSYTADASDVKLSSSADLKELAACRDFFSYLKSIDISEADLSVSEVKELEENFPAAYVNYNISIFGSEYDGHIREIDLSAVSPAVVSKDLEKLSLFLDLQKINIIKEDGSCSYDLDEYIALRNASPAAEIEYNFELFGQPVNTLQTTELYYKDQEIGDEGLEEFRAVLPYFYHLSYLSLDRCGTTDEEVARLRDDFPDTKIVWRVFYGTGKNATCMTDVETIWAIGCIGRDPEDSAGLYYCTDVKYMDIGHNSVQNIDFLYNMPNLEVLIIACGDFNDVTAVGSLKNLEYLEVGETQVEDLTPLLNCENLEHLHIGGNYFLTDEAVEPLLQLKHLKRLNCFNMGNPEFHTSEMRKKFEAAMPNTELLFGYNYGSSFWGVWRYGNGPNGYQPRYALLREQIGYDRPGVDPHYQTQ